MSAREEIYYSATTGDFLISAYREILDTTNDNRALWAYFLRIENNSDKPVCLIKKNLCITDNTGRNFYDCENGFQGELPDLQPGEYFDFEDTTVIDGQAAVLYGSCTALTDDGEKINIKIPLISLNMSAEVSKNALTH